MRTTGDLPGGYRYGSRPIFADDLVASAGDDHQVAVRRLLEDMPPLVQQVSADAAADLRPALREVAEQLRAAVARRVRIMQAHRDVQQSSVRKVPPGIKRAQFCRKILRNRSSRMIWLI